MSTLHYTYESLDIKDDRAFDVLILLIIVGALKLQFIGALWYMVNASATPQTSPRSPTSVKISSVMTTP